MFLDESFGTLYNTKRSQGQKMVDTAVACDSLSILINGNAEIVIIVSDDDDFIPPLVSAHAMGRSIFLLRKSGRTLVDVCDYDASEHIRYWE